MELDDDTLAHYGVKGMKWGVRRNMPEGVSPRTAREARKDADEFAKAKMFYGEGAGTRRKLIKAKVDAKVKKDPTYKKAFDHYVEGQDMAKRASQARSLRRRTDAKNTTGKTVRGVYRKATGGFGQTSAAAAAIYAGYSIAKQMGYDRIIADAAKRTFSEATKSGSVKRGEQILRDFMNS